MAVSDLSKQELTAISRVVELYDEIFTTLCEVDARPSGPLHIESEYCPGYLGWVGFNENGDITFQPSEAHE